MILTRISAAVIPLVMSLCALLVLTSKKPMFELFMGGIKSGAGTALKLFPTLCALCCAVAMFSACGAAEFLGKLFSYIGVPEGLAQFAVMRPISGSASTAMLADIFKNYGADSLTGIAASVMMATSDTLVYVISVYHSAAGIKKSRFTAVAALIAMVVTTVAAIAVSRWLFP